MINKKNYEGALLALDTASRKTGYAVFKGGKIIASGTWVIKQKDYHKQLCRNISTSVERWGITQIVAEDIFKDSDQRKSHAYEVLCECKGVVKLCAQLACIGVFFIQPIEVKQQVYGYKRRFNYTRAQHKKAMINAVKRLGYKLQSDEADDEADAIGLIIAYLGRVYAITHPA